MSLIESALRERYRAPAWALFFQVSNGTGAYHRRYADALAMGLFPSRGLDFHGFEIKSNRQDWLSELKNPDKAETIAKYCDFWWLVLGSPEIAKMEEVPENWGLLVMNGKSLRQAKKAVRLKPKDASRPFLAAVLRRANEAAEDERKKSQDKHSMNQATMDAYERGRKIGIEQGKEEVQDGAREYEDLKKSVADFEKESGVKISRWNGGKIGEAVSALLDLQHRGVAFELERLGQTLEEAAADYKEKAKALKSAVTGLKRAPSKPS
jgi:hypothetical protein